MSWKDEFYSALLKFTQEKLDVNAVNIIEFNQRHDEGAHYSEYTIDPDRIYIEIVYEDKRGYSRQKEWDGNFADLINELDKREE